MRPLKLNTAFAVPIGPAKHYLDGKTEWPADDDFDATDITCELLKADGSSELLTLTKTGGDNNIYRSESGTLMFSGVAANVNQAGNMSLIFRNAIKDGFSTERILSFREDFNVVEMTQSEISEMLGGDEFFDTTKTPWQYVLTKKGDVTTEYKRKNCYDKDMAPVTNINQVVVYQLEPEDE